jgi:GAF domain-containing protein
MRKRRAVVVADATHADAASVGRFSALGAVRTVIVAPVMQSGRFLGVIEVVNALDGAPFTDEEGNALSYIAEQYAEFVATVGVVTDPERINAGAQSQR